MITVDKEQLAYYEKELLYLREQGAAFAHKHPKVASALGLNPEGSSDPQVQRLIESFAFLSSNLQRMYDDQFPLFSQTLLSVLYPQLVAPVPPMSIASFALDPSKGKSTTGHLIPKNTELYINSSEGVPCRFRTGYDLKLWPLEIENVVIEPAGLHDLGDAFSPYPFVLRVDIKTMAKKLQEYDIDELCLYINADNVIANWLFECFFLTDNNYAVIDPEGNEKKIIKSPSAMEKVGFTLEESILPEFPQSLPSYNILLEYFSFPQKFMFLKLKRLSLKHCKERAQLVIPLSSHDDTLKKSMLITRDSIKLGCTPIVNLFTQQTDPVDFNKTQISYPLIPDVRRERFLEIHSILDVCQTIKNSNQVKKISPYFSYDHGEIVKDQQYFYHARTVPSPQGMPGTKTEISFVDLSFQAKTPLHETIYARALCTNRNLASFIEPGMQLAPNESLPVSSIKALFQPTPSIYNPGEGNYHWQLISQLSTDFISAGHNEEVALKTLREAINVFRRQVEHGMVTDGSDLVGYANKPAVRRLGRDAWRGFVQGYSLYLTCSEASFAKRDVLLFSAVLNQYINTFCSTNSFVEINIRKPNSDRIWKTWPAMLGQAAMI